MRNQAEPPSGRKGTTMDDLRWFYLDARGARLFRPGERVRPGEQLGAFGGRAVVYDADEGIIASIQYDVWRDQVILGVAPGQATRREEPAGRR
ncbi:MAG: hypothetical protein K6U89_02635 [Chloroflexi bacterium]|nr:hypothetical protein [Chloroflexota bacterium]GIW10108.1 MAG: hypothetical protein KatS3mg061_1165 [Dehalococcoidia bacterium]